MNLPKWPPPNMHIDLTPCAAAKCIPAESFPITNSASGISSDKSAIEVLPIKFLMWNLTAETMLLPIHASSWPPQRTIFRLYLSLI